MSEVAEKTNYSDTEEKGQISQIEEGSLRQSNGELQSPTTPTLSPEEKALVWKLDKRILPITCLLYLFACEYLLEVTWCGQN